MARMKETKKYKGWASLSDERAKQEKERINKRREAAVKNAAGRMTNASFAATDEGFKNACQRAGVEPTARQASKWFRKMGRAYEAQREIDAEARKAAMA